MGREVRVTQEKKEKEGGRKEEKRAGEKIDEDEDDEYVEGSEGTINNTLLSLVNTPCIFFTVRVSSAKSALLMRNGSSHVCHVTPHVVQVTPCCILEALLI